eukprot:TRINITY_DN3760_c0_g1_i13.p1 TRINITY_DN3760_c0_g1~~TRINITY_DN3760_c0_g1_i13.p1  ORF type:complete len:246 (+),score=53.07 TRINITY_DN3760_c0_g1_i13:107-844(+)
MNDEEVFWTFIALVNNMLIHDPMRMYGASNIYTASKENLNLLKHVFNVNFVNEMPELRLHFQSIQFAEALWLHRWILEMFLESFPFKYCLRFWDYILGYGYSGIIKISLAILATTKQAFEGKDYAKCCDILESFKKGENLPTPDEIVERAEKVVLRRRKVGPAGSSKQGFSVCRESGIMIGIEDEPDVGDLCYMNDGSSASRSKLSCVRLALCSLLICTLPVTLSLDALIMGLSLIHISEPTRPY